MLAFFCVLLYFCLHFPHKALYIWSLLASLGCVTGILICVYIELKHYLKLYHHFVVACVLTLNLSVWFSFYLELSFTSYFILKMDLGLRVHYYIKITKYSKTYVHLFLHSRFWFSSTSELYLNYHFLCRN